MRSSCCSTVQNHGYCKMNQIYHFCILHSHEIRCMPKGVPTKVQGMTSLILTLQLHGMYYTVKGSTLLKILLKKGQAHIPLIMNSSSMSGSLFLDIYDITKIWGQPLSLRHCKLLESFSERLDNN